MIQVENKFPGVLDQIYKKNNKDLPLLKKEIRNFLFDNNIIEETTDYISSIFIEIDNILKSNNQSNENIIKLVDFIRRREL